jgi:hypothetical protein
MADPFQTEFSLLDLFISVFGEIDESKIINLAKHIDQMLSRDENLQNIEFLIRPEKSFRKLCETFTAILKLSNPNLDILNFFKCYP